MLVTNNKYIYDRNNELISQQIENINYNIKIHSKPSKYKRINISFSTPSFSSIQNPENFTKNKMLIPAININDKIKNTNIISQNNNFKKINNDNTTFPCL